MKNKFKHFKEMIKTRDVNKEKFNELIKNSLHDEYMYVRETALVVGDEMIDHVNDLFDNGLVIEDIKLLYEDELYISMGLSPKYLITRFMLRVAPRTNT